MNVLLIFGPKEGKKVDAYEKEILKEPDSMNIVSHHLHCVPKPKD